MLVGFLAIVASITVHEFAHAFTADRLGDPTPRNAGRLSLNPAVIMRAHPFGALIMPLIGAYTGFLIGWAATPVNPARARKVSLRTAEFLIAAAGPISNVLLVLLAIGAAVALYPYQQTEWGAPLWAFSVMMVIANVILAVFNIVPIPPLDGYTVLESKAPESWAGALGFIRQYSMVFFILLILYFGKAISPLLNWVAGLLMSLAAAVWG